MAGRRKFSEGYERVTKKKIGVHGEGCWGTHTRTARPKKIEDFIFKKQGDKGLYLKKNKISHLVNGTEGPGADHLLNLEVRRKPSPRPLSPRPRHVDAAAGSRDRGHWSIVPSPGLRHNGKTLFVVVAAAGSYGHEGGDVAGTGVCSVLDGFFSARVRHRRAAVQAHSPQEAARNKKKKRKKRRQRGDGDTIKILAGVAVVVDQRRK